LVRLLSYTLLFIYPYADQNQLSGTISQSISQLTNLQMLGLHQNNFEGTFPAANLTSLQQVDISGNHFVGM
jgi:Leucine-rich repeat (LRR) protein